MSYLLARMPDPHLATLDHLMHHLHTISLSSNKTGMTPRNLAIVWAPNLLRAPPSLHHEALTDEIRDISSQARLVELMISEASSLFPKKHNAHKGSTSRRPAGGGYASLWKKVGIRLLVHNRLLPCIFKPYSLVGPARCTIWVVEPTRDLFLRLGLYANSIN